MHVSRDYSGAKIRQHQRPDPNAPLEAPVCTLEILPPENDDL